MEEEHVTNDAKTNDLGGGVEEALEGTACGERGISRCLRCPDDERAGNDLRPEENGKTIHHISQCSSTRKWSGKAHRPNLSAKGTAITPPGPCRKIPPLMELVTACTPMWKSGACAWNNVVPIQDCQPLSLVSNRNRSIRVYSPQVIPKSVNKAGINSERSTRCFLVQVQFNGSAGSSLGWGMSAVFPSFVVRTLVSAAPVPTLISPLSSSAMGVSMLVSPLRLSSVDMTCCFSAAACSGSEDMLGVLHGIRIYVYFERCNNTNTGI
jgi:hypothetical protein